MKLRPLVISGWLLIALAACGPGRSAFQRYPGAPATFDKAGSNPQAVEVADKVIAAAGGAAAWDKARQIRWTTTTDDKKKQQVEEAWDRWNGRHWLKLDLGEQGNLVAIHELYGDYKA